MSDLKVKYLRLNSGVTKAWGRWMRKSWRNKEKPNDMTKGGNRDNVANLHQNGGRKQKTKRRQKPLLDHATSSSVSNKVGGLKNRNKKFRGKRNRKGRNENHRNKQKGERHVRRQVRQGNVWKKKRGKQGRTQQRRMRWKKIQQLRKECMKKRGRGGKKGRKKNKSCQRLRQRGKTGSRKGRAGVSSF